MISTLGRRWKRSLLGGSGGAAALVAVEGCNRPARCLAFSRRAGAAAGCSRVAAGSTMLCLHARPRAACARPASRSVNGRPADAARCSSACSQHHRAAGPTACLAGRAAEGAVEGRAGTCKSSSPVCAARQSAMEAGSVLLAMNQELMEPFLFCGCATAAGSRPERLIPAGSWASACRTGALAGHGHCRQPQPGVAGAADKGLLAAGPASCCAQP